MRNAITIMLVLCFFSGLTQPVIQDNLVGKAITFESEVLGEQREIQVYLPKGYQDSEKNYPVLYLLDGQRWFLYTVSQQLLFSEYQYTPDFIVVGIRTDDSPRFRFFADSEKLQSYLKDEVVSFVESRFRTSDERLLFGWQFAAAFAIKSMITDPGFFDAYLAASPIPLSRPETSITDQLGMTKSLFIGVSENEDQVNAGVDDFVEYLKDQAPSSLNWEHKKMNLESISSFGHRTTPLGTIYHGLRYHYGDYPLLEFDRLEDFNNAGGFEYVYEYYERRGEKYGISREIPQEGMFFLVRLGLDADSYPVFKRFMDDFIEKDFLENVNLGWGTRYAEFSLRNDDAEGAQRIYDILIRRFPENARPLNGKGKALAAMGEIRQARRLYQQAIDLAEKNADRRIDQYKRDLEDLKSDD